jgi:hypothetical protein
MSQWSETGQAAGAEEEEEPEVPEEGRTSDQVLHAQEESKAEGDRDDRDNDPTG